MAESNASKLANNILTDGKFDATDVVGTLAGFTSTGIDDNATSTAMTIDSNENVGIGLTDPTGKLHIISGEGLIIDKTNNGYSGTRIHDDGSGDYNSYIDLGRNQSGTRLTIRKGGRVQGTTPWTNDTPSAICSFAYGGIAFGSSTGTADTLDDYEEGTWTPVFAGGSTSGTYTYLEQQGHYVKVGSLVTAWFNLTNITTSSAGSGTIQILGLPFSANWQNGFNGGGVSGSMEIHDFNNISGVHTFVNLGDGTSQFSINKQSTANNGSSGIAVTDKNSDSSDIRGFVTYYTGG